jgi:hypothetical protein
MVASRPNDASDEVYRQLVGAFEEGSGPTVYGDRYAASDALRVGRETTEDVITAQQNRERYVGEDNAAREGLRTSIDRYNGFRVGEAAARGISLAPTVENAIRLGLISSDAVLEGLAPTSTTYPLVADAPIIARDMQPEAVAARAGYAPEIDQRYYFAPGFVSSSYSQALSLMRSESWFDRGVGLVGATAMFPTMLLEEGGRAAFNVPYHGGQMGQNAAEFVTANSTEEQVVAALNFTRNASSGIVGAGVLVPSTVSMRAPTTFSQSELRAAQASYAIDTMSVDAEMAGFTSASQAMIRERVLANIAESQAARGASRFEIHLAKTDQIRWGYAADEWGLTTLQPGDRIFGGLPGQSAYYTSAATLEASGGSREVLFQSLQVRAHPEFGYRPTVGEYEVINPLTVPSGTVSANPAFGMGGGDQLFIRTYQDSLRLVREIMLGR